MSCGASGLALQFFFFVSFFFHPYCGTGGFEFPLSNNVVPLTYLYLLPCGHASLPWPRLTHILQKISALKTLRPSQKEKTIHET